MDGTQCWVVLSQTINPECTDIVFGSNYGSCGACAPTPSPTTAPTTAPTNPTVYQIYQGCSTFNYYYYEGSYLGGSIYINDVSECATVVFVDATHDDTVNLGATLVYSWYNTFCPYCA
jgi:hypothetical protein